MSGRRQTGGSPLALLALVPWLAAAAPFERTEKREPCADHTPLRRPFFGDTHVHTAFSFDAWGQGTRNTPRDAYRFARGEPLGIQPFDENGNPLRKVQLRRPLDFAVVTDHAELLGETHICGTPGAPGYDSFICTLARRWPKLGYMIVNSQTYDISDPVRYDFCGPDGRTCIEAAATPWKAIQHAAEEGYDRSSSCAFTTFVGYEWTGNPESSMIHRNVIFRNEIVPALPATYVEEKTGEAFWRKLRSDCLDLDNGCDVLAIPHNSNLSAGLLFRVETEQGQPLTREDAETRSQLEVLVEVTQHKGDSECRMGGPTADELCGFETLPYARIWESALPWRQTTPPPLSYVREVLSEGLVQHEKLGANPFKLGLIGSTDSHLGTPGLVNEDQFVGHAAGTTSSRLEIPAPPDRIEYNPGGLAVVWAEENSRDALFAAMRRRETYGTSGPRMSVRFFASWSYPENLCDSHEFVAQAYAQGVPMGGDLPPLAPGTASAGPVFAVSALKDPGTAGHPGTPLQRIQVIKLWAEDGAARERVYEVAGDPKNGAGVDLGTCQPRGRGFDGLCQVWRDPDFDPEAHAAYYARVVENPSCRWNTFLCVQNGVNCSDPGSVPDRLAFCCDPALPKTIQERTWTSPIWYSPRKQ